MPHYVTLMKWTSQGRMGLPAWRDRVEEGEQMIQAAGGKLVGVWVTLGQYDVVEVFEAPDDETALEIITKLSATAPSKRRRCAPSRGTRRKRSSASSRFRQRRGSALDCRERAVAKQSRFRNP